MGMDLEPINPSPDAPRDKDGNAEWGRYNWGGWSWLVDHLEKWGVDTSEFRGVNDGDPICEATCKAVADAMEKHYHELEEEYRAGYEEKQSRATDFAKGDTALLRLLQPSTIEDQMEGIRIDIKMWRTCGGYKQW